MVSTGFGLSQSQLNARYFGLRPLAKESSESFILRVGLEQRSHGANEDATMHCFVPRLDHAIQTSLEHIRATKAALQGTALAWADVVLHARDRLTHAPLVTQSAPAVLTPELPRQPATTTPPAPAQGGHSGRICSYCEPLGSGMENHESRWCFINPASP